MKLTIKTDKVTRITFFIIILILIGLVWLVTPSIIQSHQIVNDTFFVKQCGLSETDHIKIFDGTLIHNRIFLFPYDAVKINSNDYFSLKKNIPYVSSKHNRVTTEEYRQFFTKVIFTGSQSKYYPAILKKFQTIKTQHDLDDDEYLQLIVKFVQSMPYNTNHSHIKYPIITFTDGCGDCDDKSLLLVALLSQEDYNVSIINIPPEGSSRFGHAMAGIASNSATFTLKGYAMIETTASDSPIGEFPAYLKERNDIQINKIVNGTKTFETYSQGWISDEGQFKIIKKSEKIVSITPYDEKSDFLDFFRKKTGNFNWENDCDKGLYPASLCRYSRIAHS